MPKFLPSVIETDLYFDQELWSIEGNESELQTVLMNLAANSRDAILPKNGKFSVEAKNVRVGMDLIKPIHRKPGPYVLLRVQDNGKGIPEHVIHRIFEPFYSTKEKGKGTGLGLSMVFSIIEDHRGWIEVESQPDKGASFLIYLPAKPNAKVEEDEGVSLVLSKGNELILFVDDEEILRNLGKVFLEKLGYKILFAKDGEEAVQTYKNNQETIAGCIMDVTMPKMTGKQALQAILKTNPKAKIILMSGFNTEGTESEFIELGAKDFLSKPFTLGPLSQKLRAMLDA